MQGGLQIINLHFNSRMFDDRCSISKKYSNLFFSHSDGFGTRIPAACAASVRALIEKIREELEQARPEYECYVYSLLDLLFCQLIREHGYYLPKDGVHTSMERIRASLRYIDIHYTEEITLEQIAGQSGLSPHYFTRLFRECFHMKLWDYVLSRRIDAAKRMLTGENGITILQIALNCGFHNTANFNRAFLRFTGVTPREYRKGGTIH
jgi:AraC-like DNA-binding protein